MRQRPGRSAAEAATLGELPRQQAMRQWQGGSRAAPRQCWRQHPLLLGGDGFHRRTTCLAHTEMSAHKRVDASAIRQQTRACATSASNSGESVAGSAVGSAGGDVGRLHGNGRCQLLLFRQFYINLYIYIYMQKTKNCRNYICSSSWEKSAFINLFQDVLV